MPDPIYVNGKKEITASKLVDIASAIRTAKDWPNDHAHKLTIDQMYDILVAGSDDMELANQFFSRTLGPTISLLPRQGTSPSKALAYPNLCNQKELVTAKIYTQINVVDWGRVASDFLCNCPKLKDVYIYVDNLRAYTTDNLNLFFDTRISDETDSDAKIHVQNQTAKTYLLTTSNGITLPSFIYTDEYKDTKIIIDPDM